MEKKLYLNRGGHRGVFDCTLISGDIGENDIAHNSSDFY